MGPPPATPTPHRFLVPKHSQPKTETPKKFQSGGQQFQNTPRFSLHSTPRGPSGGGAGPSSSIPTPAPTRSGAPSFIRPTPRATDPIHDVVDSSPPFIEQAGDGSGAHSDDPIEVFDVNTDDEAVPESSPVRDENENENNDYGHGYEENNESETELRHRSPKRRRISISSDFDIDSHLPQHQHGHDPKDADLNQIDDYDHDLIMQDTIHSSLPPFPLDSSSSQPLSPINPRSAQQQPTFLKAPRFKPTEAPEGSHIGDPLPDAFSPHRKGKGAKYVSAGLAAEVRDWFVDAWAGASAAAETARRSGGGGGGDWVARIRVDEVREAPGMALVVGRTVGVEEDYEKKGDDNGYDDAVVTQVRGTRVVLTGSPKITGLEKRQDVRPGIVVGVGRPTWEVSLPGLGRWNVVCEWAIL
ncbi:hypothetical protein F4805DRAFT_408567 [Annulohypoxylon moriforme]|nr:hypothetical protein F4805DRAFT_408567 [Annulohypoxylon moriforme]